MELRLDFEDALNKCNNEEDKSANVHRQHPENIANLLTVAKLRNFIGYNGNLSRIFQHRIRLNAIKFRGQWWSIHQFQDFKIENIAKYCQKFSEKAQPLGPLDFAFFPDFAYQNEGHDLSTLAYNPRTDALELVSHKSELKFICTHKKENKRGNVKKTIRGVYYYEGS